ncbi:MAG: HTH domain-containing protein [Candidatus Brocadiae bacterium]|nr:HTH domain-containing protein [Candidatus Brocadiia bacterium]
MNEIYVGQDLWEKYGFHTNPFDTNPLTAESSFLPIAEAMVGRGSDTKESQILTNFLRNRGGGRILIEGNIGVGKTTFINYHRYLWEHYSRDRLFTTNREISVTSRWQISQFLGNILASLLSKLLSQFKEEKILKNSIFKEVLAFSRVFYNYNYTIEASALGFGGGFGKSEQINVPNISESQLLEYFSLMVLEIKKLGYAGLFLHLDNLELLNREDLRRTHTFFEEIRDILQVTDVYFVFVAKRGFFREVISPLERVRSIFFGRPVVVNALTKEQVLDAVHRRYHLLSITKDKFIAPVEDSFIEYLHDLYGGRLRYIMDALNMLLPEIATKRAETISTEQAQKKLKNLVAEQTREHLTPLEWNLLLFCCQQENFTNGYLSNHFSLPTSNISRILNRLSDLDMIYLDQKEGKNIYYRVSEFAKPLKDWKDDVMGKNDTTISREIDSTNKTRQLQNSRKQRLNRIIRFIQERGEIQQKDCAEFLKISLATVSRDMKELIYLGNIVCREDGKQKYYRIKNP